ncbi:AAA family ATPase [Microbacterium sp. STN6]|uniref:AAA family ATPase n=1 Tax=Microbacterium sp. STN6 TaxID=2995588 RepID=UPI002260FBC0|nr:AAA family ATPase [Microbacterium sp. STN6]MCX7522216.1 AAA family ATPase [Microbacterium sp. STN6]
MDAAEDWLYDSRPIRRVSRFRDIEPDFSAWPASIPAVRQVLDEGLEFPAGVTFIVGENGSGKSTLVEGIAVAAGLPAEGGSNQGSHATRASESPLGEWLRVERSPSGPRWGFFLRAETMHGYYTWLEQLGGPDRMLHELSHGESFNALLDDKLDHPLFVAGLACLDEPEAALSFTSTLKWLASLQHMVDRGTQVICATHSPVLASLPGARILEVGEWGIRRSEWEDLELVRNWRLYLEAPGRFLRHLL